MTVERDVRTGSVARLAVFLFFALASVYGLSAGGHTYAGDEEALLQNTRQILEGDPGFTLPNDNDWIVTPSAIGRDGKAVAIGGIGQSVAAIPLYLVGTAVSTFAPEDSREFVVRKFVFLTNPILTALIAVVVLYLSLELGASPRAAGLLAVCYGLGTWAWPHAKTFFSEPGTSLCLALSLLWAIRAADCGSPRQAWWSGLAIGGSILFRVSAGIFVPLVGCYVLFVGGARHGWRRGLRMSGAFGTGATALLLALLFSNWWRFGSVWQTGYSDPALMNPIWQGLQGYFFSPGKSLFLYAPIAAIGLVALPFHWSRKPAETTLLLSVAAANLLFFAAFLYWHGDHAWGPRYQLIILPAVVVLAAPLADRPGWSRAVRIATLTGAASAVLGVLIYFNQYFGVVADQVGAEPVSPGTARYHHVMRKELYWSPLLGHARLLPTAIRNTVDRIDGDDEARGHRPFPSSRHDRFFWYWAPVQLDPWWTWIGPEHSPRWSLLLLAPLGTGLVVGTTGVRRWYQSVDRPDSPVTIVAARSANIEPADG